MSHYENRTCSECIHAVKVATTARILAGAIVATDLECRLNPPGVMLLPGPGGALQVIVSFLPIKSEFSACSNFQENENVGEPEN